VYNKRATEGFALAKDSIEQLLAQNQEYISRHQLQELHTAIFLVKREQSVKEPPRRLTIARSVSEGSINTSNESHANNNVARSDVVATGNVERLILYLQMKVICTKRVVREEIGRLDGSFVLHKLYLIILPKR
jgi:hypothetical protein